MIFALWLLWLLMRVWGLNYGYVRGGLWYLLYIHLTM